MTCITRHPVQWHWPWHVVAFPPTSSLATLLSTRAKLRKEFFIKVRCATHRSLWKFSYDSRERSTMRNSRTIVVANRWMSHHLRVEHRTQRVAVSRVSKGEREQKGGNEQPKRTSKWWGHRHGVVVLQWKEWKERGGTGALGPHTTLHASATRLHCLIVNDPVALIRRLFACLDYPHSIILPHDASHANSSDQKENSRGAFLTVPATFNLNEKCSSIFCKIYFALFIHCTF